MRRFFFAGILMLLAVTVIAGTSGAASTQGKKGDAARDNAVRMTGEGRKIFRYDTFGDEAFRGDTLKIHPAIAGSQHGGVGSGVSPKTALAVGLKVDSDALPAALAKQIKAGKVDVDNPATTLALLKLNAMKVIWLAASIM